MSSQALIKEPGRSPRLEIHARPKATPGTAVLRVATVGLCRTDLLVADDSIKITTPLILGHEFSGWVEDVGSGADAPAWIAPGALAAVNPTATGPFGADAYMGLDFDGSIATHVRVPFGKLHDAAGMDPRVAAYLEPVACALGSVDVLRTLRGRGLLIGGNRIASLTEQALRGDGAKNGYDLDVMDMDELRGCAAELACAYDWVVETNATQEMFALAALVLKRRGTLVVKSRHPGARAIEVRDYVLKEISVVGRTRSGFPEAMSWLRSHEAFVAGLIGAEFDIGDWQRAFAAANAGEAGKTFIKVNGA